MKEQKSCYWFIESIYGYDGAEFAMPVTKEVALDRLYYLMDISRGDILEIEPTTKLELYASGLDIY